MKLHWVSAQRLVKIATLANVVITRFWGEVVAVTNNVGLFAISYRFGGGIANVWPRNDGIR